MRVVCITGSEGVLKEGDIYTVTEITKRGNFILDEVSVPEGFTSFDANRFIPIQDIEDNWTEEMEESYCVDQNQAQYN
jgi:hypothetical protein